MTTEYMKQAEAVLDVIERNPEKHDQGVWGEQNACGTTACVAGHIALLNDDAQYILNHANRMILMLNPGTVQRGFEWYAGEKLGLEDDDAYLLFYKTNNEQAKEALKYLAKGESIPWDIVGHSPLD